jgi:hypothetical protein
LSWKPLKRKKALAGEGVWTWEDHENEQAASAYESRHGVRLTWMFPLADSGVANMVVSGCQPQADDIHRMTLYGIQARFPSAFVPEAVQVHPANHMLSVTGPKQSRMVYRRWGLPHQILQGESPQDFFRKLLKAEDMRIESVESETLWGQAADRIHFTSKGLTPLQRACFRRVPGVGWIWLDSGAQRLCVLEQLGSNAVKFPTPEDCFDVW